MDSQVAKENGETNALPAPNCRTERPTRAECDNPFSLAASIMSGRANRSRKEHAKQRKFGILSQVCFHLPRACFPTTGPTQQWLSWCYQPSRMAETHDVSEQEDTDKLFGSVDMRMRISFRKDTLASPMECPSSQITPVLWCPSNQTMCVYISPVLSMYPLIRVEMATIFRCHCDSVAAVPLYYMWAHLPPDADARP